MKIIYIQNDQRVGAEVQFCYSKDMQPLDNWVESVYGDAKEGVFHAHWEHVSSVNATGIRNLNVTELSVEDFMTTCELLGYTVKRVNNELSAGNDFKVSCLQSYPEDFKQQAYQNADNKKPTI